MTALASLIRDFAALLAPDPANAARLQEWITPPGPPTCPTSTPSPAAWTWTSRPSQRRSRCPSTTAGPRVNTKTKMIKRQMYGRARLLSCHRILLG